MSSAKLTQGTVSSGLLSLTVPMMLGIFANLGAALFETFLLGKVGTTALAAYSFTFPVTGALGSLSLGISIGLSSVLARTVGSGDQDMIRRLATDGIALLAVVMIVVSVAGYFTIDYLFIAMGANGDTLPQIRSYMQIWYFALIFFSLPAIGANALRATGDARISGSIMVGGAAMQVILDPLLIFGLAGLPQLGLEGAAWATLISRLILCGLTYYVLIYKENLLDFSPVSSTMLLASWRRIMAVGIPATATQLIGPVSTAIIVAMLADFGTEAVAGYGIASRVEGLFVIPLFALSASIGPFVGQNWGASRYDRADQGMKLSFLWSLGWGLLVSVLLFLLAPFISRMFDDNHEVSAYAETYLRLVPISYGAWGVLMMTSAIFNSLGKPLASTTMSVVRMFVIYVPLAWLGQRLIGVNGIFLAACASNTIMGLLGYVWNRRTFLPQIRQESATL
ncbi:MAG: MATE family efflux transporter [Pseudomonadales bacterium]|nr:MATE family efflux transporter [Pseudomonadales bacterium]